MTEPFLLSRILLRFDDISEDLRGNLSAVTSTPDGSLWVASDELVTVERLSLIDPHVYGHHHSFHVGQFFDLADQEGEIDIEGMAYDDHYLWFTGSHSTKRLKAKGKNPVKALQRLTTIKTDPNRYLMGRIPVVGGELSNTFPHPDQPERRISAACLPKTEHGNVLTDALRQDVHLGPFLSFPLPSKENGFDIEGMAARGNRVFLGFRGPVLRGWAIIIEIEVEEQTPGVLTLKPIGEGGQPYKKHFVNLGGMGVRELCFRGDDLIVLSGPTMESPGQMQISRLKGILGAPGDSMSSTETGDMEVLFDIPFRPDGDNAEGLAIIPCLGQPDALLVVYDSPHASRLVGHNMILVDVFRM